MQQEISAATSPITIFYSFAEKDKTYQQELEKRLSLLKRQGLITEWHYCKIIAGMEQWQEIDTHLNTAQIILLLVSPDFLASEYYFSHEMQRALIRHANREAWIIPILLRPCE